MELSSIPARHQHRQNSRSRHQDRHRQQRVATTQELGSDHEAYLPLRPNRNEYAPHGDRHGLVKAWLEDIETPQLQPVRNNGSLSEEPSPGTSSRHRATHRLRSPSQSKLFFHNSHDGEALKISPRTRMRERKRPRDLIQHNSVLDLCGEQDQVPKPVQPGTRPVLPAIESSHDSCQEWSPRGSKGSRFSVISEAHDPYAKKARHKTRSDRYETTRGQRAHKPGKDKKRKKRSRDQRKSKETRKGGGFSSAREVMDNFNSRSILSDRITVSTPVPGQCSCADPRFRYNLL
jgi:hypothetical protein